MAEPELGQLTLSIFHSTITNAYPQMYTHTHVCILTSVHIHTLAFCHLKLQGSCPCYPYHSNWALVTREPVVGDIREVKKRKILAPTCPFLCLIPIFFTACDFPCCLESSDRDATSCWYRTCPLPGELTSLYAWSEHPEWPPEARYHWKWQPSGSARSIKPSHRKNYNGITSIIDHKAWPAL